MKNLYRFREEMQQMEDSCESSDKPNPKHSHDDSCFKQKPSSNDWQNEAQLARAVIQPDEIFVFGSNLAGRHGAGAALKAKNEYGAIYGIGIGRQGSSYAIPTKDYQIKVLPLSEIEKHIKTFLEYALSHSSEKFFVTRVGCGLAGYRNEQIAPLFKGAPDNCRFDEQWIPFLTENQPSPGKT